MQTTDSINRLSTIGRLRLFGVLLLARVIAPAAYALTVALAIVVLFREDGALPERISSLAFASIAIIFPGLCLLSVLRHARDARNALEIVMNLDSISWRGLDGVRRSREWHEVNELVVSGEPATRWGPAQMWISSLRLAIIFDAETEDVAKQNALELPLYAYSAPIQIVDWLDDRIYSPDQNVKRREPFSTIQLSHARHHLTTLRGLLAK